MKNVDKLGIKENPCTTSGVSEIALLDKIKSVLTDIEKMETKGEWYGFMHDEKNAKYVTKLWNHCR